MPRTNRREFLDQIGRGMLLAGLGASLSSDLGVSAAFAEVPVVERERSEPGRGESLGDLGQDPVGRAGEPVAQHDEGQFRRRPVGPVEAADAIRTVGAESHARGVHRTRLPITLY